MAIDLIPRYKAAEFLGVKTETLATWASTKRYNLPVVHIGRKAMYRMNDLEAFVKANTVGGSA